MKRTRFLTVDELKKIMESAISSSDARVLVYCRGRKTEYLVARVGQFGVIPNLTIDIVPSPDGFICNQDKEEK